MTVADNRSDDLKEEGRGCGRGVIGISLGAFSTFVAGSTREGEIKEIIGSDGEQCLRTIFDLATDKADSEHQISGACNAILPIRLDQLLAGSRDHSKAFSDVDAVRVIGKFLGDVRDIAMRQLDAPVSECVISVPSGGSPDEIQMIVKAAKEAGFSHVHPLRECVAIALGHNMCENDAEDDDYYDRMLVCTINVGYYSSEYSIMDIHQGCIKVLASERCPIGGERMTGKLYEEVKTRFCAVNGIKTSDLNMRAQKKLFHACEVSKKSLLVKGSGPVLCESLYDGNDCNIPMSVQKIEACCSDVFKESAANITKFLSNNSITLESITHVIFAGGGMRMQKLQSICKSIFPASTEIIVSPEPEKSVMQGCRLCGHKLSIAPHASSKIKVIGTSIEICALKSPLSILLKHGKTLEIFPERTIIPAFRKIALTLNKDQKTIHVILGNKTPLAEVVLNTSAVSSGNANAHLLIVFESKSLITIGVVSNDTTVDSVDIDLSSRAIPPVTAAV